MEEIALEIASPREIALEIASPWEIALPEAGGTARTRSRAPSSSSLGWYARPEPMRCQPSAAEPGRNLSHTCPG